MLLWSGVLLVARFVGAVVNYIFPSNSSALSAELGGNGWTGVVAEIQDKGNPWISSVISHGRGGNPDSGQEGKGLWVEGEHQAGKAVKSGKGLSHYSQGLQLLRTFCTMCTVGLVQIPKPFFIIV